MRESRTIPEGEGPGRRLIIPTSRAPSETSLVGVTETTCSMESLNSPQSSVIVSEVSVESTVPSCLSVTATPFEPAVAFSPSTTTLSVSPSMTVASSVVTPISSTTATSAVPPSVDAPTTSHVSPDIPSVEGVVDTVTGVAVGTDTRTVAGGVHGPSTGSSDGDIVSTMAQLLKAQTNAMAAQAKAVVIQNLPPLLCYTGEGDDVVEDGYDKWVEKFGERARFAGSSNEDQLYQFKLHLDRTALDVFRMLPPTDSGDIERVIASMNKRFKPSDIEELRGLEFHYKTQGDESVDQLGMTIQQLGRKAFRSIGGKDFDRLLKG